ncbi:MAG: hypothetical protein DI535_10355 [Citrobacter freundii]|nr:MAG: hypothetical protein DI535_10355 [Citrobacter freundii]
MASVLPAGSANGPIFQKLIRMICVFDGQPVHSKGQIPGKMSRSAGSAGTYADPLRRDASLLPRIQTFPDLSCIL